MNEQVLVDTSGVPIFWAKFGVTNDKYSLKIIKPLSIEEHKVRSA